ncbi:phytoene desaturase family protein [Tessaracoccus antarcticus]|uniref:NAD(P)/FAD-dependent oxidoreductase n=1 Tax=Tessaracoccus antarcticus TaxID=2479848 RepID=A0A3M0GS74_9ACTN|nr:NAD(P)/FAD-dependent oxidoreductase [Tessaracoccus antarcticus]RMB60166.1 NAD(P)/FAD-dependent oxidoreductase [Tessaracoccus antarcticus]
MRDVTVVGSGPNGLAAAIAMARHGLEVVVLEGAESIGGGLRTRELTLPGFRHDVCSAIHPAAVTSPFFREIGLLEALDWLTPEASYAHPLDDAPAAVAWHDLDRTVEGLGSDGDMWRHAMEPLVRHVDGVVDLTGHQLLRVPHDLRATAHFGLRTLALGTGLDRHLLRGDGAAALLAGCMAHAAGRMPSLAQAGAGLLLAAHGHAGGWGYPRGGSQAIADAMVEELARHGGRVETGHFVTDLRELETSRAVLLDTSPELLRTSPTSPASYRRALNRYRYGSGVAKVDLALSGPVPWLDPPLALAPTLHLGGSRDAITASENAVARGRVSPRPYFLAAQPSNLDDSRAPGSGHTFWAYMHVPRNSTVDPLPLLLSELERHAPGVKELVLASSTRRAHDLEAYNPNQVGGDIYTGELSLLQLVRRPVVSRAPWRTPIPGVYLCSSATPPGPAVHGMNGWYAAQLALRDMFGVSAQIPSA